MTLGVTAWILRLGGGVGQLVEPFLCGVMVFRVGHVLLLGQYSESSYVFVVGRKGSRFGILDDVQL